MDLPARPELRVGVHVEVTTHEHAGSYFGRRGVVSRIKANGDLVVGLVSGDGGVRELAFSADEVRLL